MMSDQEEQQSDGSTETLQDSDISQSEQARKTTCQPLAKRKKLQPLTHQLRQTRSQQALRSENRVLAMGPESAKMLIFFENGQERLITFNLPEVSCTLEEVLNQVNVPFTDETHVQCMQNNGPRCGVDYFVSVGCLTRLEKMVENHLLLVKDGDMSDSSSETEVSTSKKSQVEQRPGSSRTRSSSGQLAVCKSCGFAGRDFSRCVRCKRAFTEEPKMVPLKKKPAKTPPQKKTCGKGRKAKKPTKAVIDGGGRQPTISTDGEDSNGSTATSQTCEQQEPASEQQETARRQSILNDIESQNQSLANILQRAEIAAAMQPRSANKVERVHPVVANVQQHRTDLQQRVATNVERVQPEVEDVQHRVATNGERVQPEVEDVQQRVAINVERVQPEVEDVQHRVATNVERVQPEVEDVQQHVTDLQQRVATNVESVLRSVDNVQQSMAELQQRVATNVESVQQGVANVQKSVTNMHQRVATGVVNGQPGVTNSAQSRQPGAASMQRRMPTSALIRPQGILRGVVNIQQNLTVMQQGLVNMNENAATIAASVQQGFVSVQQGLANVQQGLACVQQGMSSMQDSEASLRQCLGVVQDVATSVQAIVDTMRQLPPPARQGASQAQRQGASQVQQQQAPQAQQGPPQEQQQGATQAQQQRAG